VIEGGYAAVEAEFAVCIAKEIPSATQFTDPKELLPYIEGVYAAVELAASPLASLNALGPGAVVSDFGNNGGVVIGPKLSIDLLTSPADATSVSVINGQTVGSGSAERVPGGPLTALLFLVQHLGARGRTLSAGDWVSTGATTGIHEVSIGDQVEMSYAGGQRISAEIVPAKATIEA
jgi:2-keto-4-pentenoate hydratase